MPSGDEETVELKRDTLSRLGVFYKDYRNDEGFANCHWEALGYTLEEMGDDAWLERIHPDDRERARLAYERHASGESHEFECEYRVLGKDGQYRWFMSSGVAEERDENGRPLRYVGHDEDVTGLHVLREELTEAKQIAEDRAAEAEALRGAGAVVVATLDAPTAVRSVIEQLKTLVPFESALVCELDNRQLRLVGGSSDITERTWQSYAKRLLKPMLRIVQARIPDVVTQTRSDTPHNLIVPLVVRGSTVGIVVISRAEGTYTGEEVRVAMSMADYLALALSNARLYARMQQRAEIDQLSGVLTRRAFMESAEQITDASFHGGRSLSCVMVDIDHFKSINDTFGHPVGDQVIRMLGAVLRDSLHSTDVVGRFGGEEFCALLTDTSEDRAEEVAERLRSDIAQTEFGGVNRQVTASIGIASLRHDNGEDDRLTIEQMIKRADVALYNAKESGRNRVVTYQAGMTDE